MQCVILLYVKSKGVNPRRVVIRVTRRKLDEKARRVNFIYSRYLDGQAKANSLDLALFDHITPFATPSAVLDKSTGG